MTLFKTLAAALALPAALTAGAVNAGNPDQSKAHVHYVDLNLASEEGRAIFERRIDRAAEMVCGKVADGRSAMDVAIKRCQRNAIAAAKPATDQAIANYSTKRFARADAKTITLISQ